MGTGDPEEIPIEGRLAVVSRTLVELTGNIAEEANLRRRLEAQFEEFRRATSGTAHTNHLAMAPALNLVHERLDKAHQDAKSWDGQFSDHVKRLQELSAKLDQEKLERLETGAELHEKFDRLRGAMEASVEHHSGVLHAQLAKHAAQAKEMAVADERYARQHSNMSGMISRLATETNALGDAIVEVKQSCASLNDRIVSKEPDQVTESSLEVQTSETSAASAPFIAIGQLCQRCDAMNAIMLKLQTQVQKHAVAIDEIVGQCEQMMDKIVRTTAELQEDRNLRAGAVKATEEIMRWTEGQRQCDSRKILHINEDTSKELVEIRAAQVTMMEHVDLCTARIVGMSEELTQLKHLGGLVDDCQESCTALNGFSVRTELSTLKNGQSEVLDKLEKREALTDTFNAGLNESQLKADKADSAQIVDESPAYKEQFCSIRKDIGDLFGILEALDSSKLNNILDRLDSCSKSIQVEQVARQASVQNLEAQMKQSFQETRHARQRLEASNGWDSVSSGRVPPTDSKLQRRPAQDRHSISAIPVIIASSGRGSGAFPRQSSPLVVGSGSGPVQRQARIISRSISPPAAAPVCTPVLPQRKSYRGPSLA